MSDQALASTPAESDASPQVSPGRASRRTASGATLSAVPASPKSRKTRDNLPAGWTLVPMAKENWFAVPAGPERTADFIGHLPHDPATEDLPRGVYRRQPSGLLLWRADLPYIHARIIYRDADGEPSSVAYLLSRTPDGRTLLIHADDLRDLSWTDRLELEISHDDSIIRAVRSAIKALSLLPEVPVREAAPTVTERGTLSVADPRALPSGYLRVGPSATVDHWQGIASIVARSLPKMALVVGASLAAPYLAPLDRQSHLIDLYGEAAQGKTTALRLAGSVWGNPGDGGDGGTVASWDVTTIGIGRMASDLKVLPLYVDESGMAPMTALERARFAFKMAESGGARITAKRNGPGVTRGRKWGGIMFVSGNDSFIDPEACAGSLSGVFRRVIALSSPFTASAADAEEIKPLIKAGYGWLGAQAMATYTLGDVGKAIAWAEGQIGLSEDGTRRSLAQHLAAAVAGALMADRLIGTGEDRPLTTLALRAAREHLDEFGQAPRHDADRLIDAVRAEIAATPAAYPYDREYAAQEDSRPEWPSTGGRLPQRGVAREVCGLRADDDSRILVLPATMTRLVADLGISRGLACKRLVEDGRLSVPESLLKRREYAGKVTVGGQRISGYVLTVSPWPEPEPGEQLAPAGPVEDVPDEPPAPTGPDALAAWVADSLAKIPAMDAAGLASIDWREMEGAVAAGHLNPLDLAAMRATAQARADQLTPAEVPAAPVPLPTQRQAPEGDSAGTRARSRQASADVARPTLDMTAVEAARDLEPAKAMAHGGPVDRAAIKAGMALLKATRNRTGTRLDLVKFPPLADILRKPDKKTADEVWEARPDWANPSIAAGIMVDQLDVNAAYLSAVKTHLPTGKLEHRDGPQDFDPRRSGFYSIVPPAWAHDNLPNPLGNRLEDGPVWIGRPTLKLLLDLAKRGYCEAPAILESWTSGASEIHMEDWRVELRDQRARAIEQGDDLATYFVKQTYSKTISTLGESSSNYEICRPDWLHLIHAQAYANLYLKALKAYEAGLTVAKVTGTDELHVVGDWRTAVDAKTGKPIFREGRALTEIKSKGTYAWEPPAPKRPRTRRPATKPVDKPTAARTRATNARKGVK